MGKMSKLEEIHKTPEETRVLTTAEKYYVSKKEEETEFLSLLTHPLKYIHETLSKR